MKLYVWQGVLALKRFGSGHCVALAETKAEAIAMIVAEYSQYLSELAYNDDEINDKVKLLMANLEDAAILTVSVGSVGYFWFGSE